MVIHATTLHFTKGTWLQLTHVIGCLVLSQIRITPRDRLLLSCIYNCLVASLKFSQSAVLFWPSKSTSITRDWCHITMKSMSWFFRYVNQVTSHFYHDHILTVKSLPPDTRNSPERSNTKHWTASSWPTSEETWRQTHTHKVNVC